MEPLYYAVIYWWQPAPEGADWDQIDAAWYALDEVLHQVTIKYLTPRKS